MDGDDDKYWAEVEAKNTKTSKKKAAKVRIVAVENDEGEQVEEEKVAPITAAAASAPVEKTISKANKYKDKKKSKSSSIFFKSTSQTEWEHEESGRKYVVRYVKGDICNNVPWIGLNQWVTIKIPSSNGDGEDGEEGDDGEGPLLNFVIGIVSVVGGDVVGVWGCDEGDGHIDLFVSKEYSFPSDFDDLSSHLCTEICPEMVDVFDDGSGIDREPVLVPNSVLLPLSEWYSCK
jgi:hypothetical protein